MGKKISRARFFDSESSLRAPRSATNETTTGARFRMEVRFCRNAVRLGFASLPKTQFGYSDGGPTIRLTSGDVGILGPFADWRDNELSNRFCQWKTNSNYRSASECGFSGRPIL